MATRKSPSKRSSPKQATSTPSKRAATPPRGRAATGKAVKAPPGRAPERPAAEGAKLAKAKRAAVPKRGPTGARAAPKAPPKAGAQRGGKQRTKHGAARRALPENPEALRLARTLAKVAADKKATDVLILDVRARGSLVGYDYLVLASGESSRQLDAIAQAMDEQTRAAGRRATSTEASSDWVLLDYDDVIAHLFTPEKRGVYDLEGFWSDAARIGLPA